MGGRTGYAVVVPTRNRPDYLPGLFDAIATQGTKARAVVVVDASDEEVRPDVARAVESVSTEWRFVSADTPSAPAQRNMGSKVACEEFDDVEYVLFLDDDVRPAPDYVDRLLRLLESDTVGVVGGVSGVSQWTRTEAPRWYRVYSRFFWLSAEKPGALLRSGVNVPVSASSRGIAKADWLFGCSMWRRSVLERYQFNGSMPGGALYDDVEFSARVGREHILLVDPEARLDHLLAVEGRPDMRTHYHRWVRNRWEVVSRIYPGPLGGFAFWWSTLGEAVLVGRHAVVGNRDYRERLAGLASGVRGTLRHERMV